MTQKKENCNNKQWK